LKKKFNHIKGKRTKDTERKNDLAKFEIKKKKVSFVLETGMN